MITESQEFEFTLTQVKTKPLKKKSPGRPKLPEGELKSRVKFSKGSLRYERLKGQWREAASKYYAANKERFKAERVLLKQVKKMEEEELERKTKSMQRVRSDSV